MKTLKATCAALLFALLLSIPAYSETTPGDGHSPGSPAAVPNATPSPTPADVTATEGSGTGELDFLTLADVLWAITSIY
ncbi:MAG TPA: hypothetical protein VIW64_19155 [Pyrinomonadaceae bacterium]|jgi:hypothetical protein